MKKPKRLARNIPFTHGATFAGLPYTRFRLGFNSRDVSGPLGDYLRAATPEGGKITFLDEPPVHTDNVLVVTGLSYGIGITVHYGHKVASGFGAMCDDFRDKITGGRGKSRWARIVK